MKQHYIILAFVCSFYFLASAMSADRSDQGLFALLPREIKHIIIEYLQTKYYETDEEFKQRLIDESGNMTKNSIKNKLIYINRYGSLKLEETRPFFVKRSTFLKSGTDNNLWTSFCKFFGKQRIRENQTDFFATSLNTKNIAALVNNKRIDIYSMETKKLKTTIPLDYYFAHEGKAGTATTPEKNISYYCQECFTRFEYDDFGKVSCCPFDRYKENDWHFPIRSLAISNAKNPMLAFANDHHVFLIQHIAENDNSLHNKYVVIAGTGHEQHPINDASIKIKTIAFNKQGTHLGINYKSFKPKHEFKTLIIPLTEESWGLDFYFKKISVHKNW